MGGDRIRTEPVSCCEFKDNLVAWHYYKEGRISPYLERLDGYNEALSEQFARSWQNRWVSVGGIRFEVSERVITLATIMSTQGLKLQQKTKIADLSSQQLFLGVGKELVPYQGSFDRAKLPEPWDAMCFILMKYFTLKGRFTRFYNYHLPLLNHFHRNAKISFPFYLLSSLEHSVLRVQAKLAKNTTMKPIPLHQGLILCLYNHHLALEPSKTITTNSGDE